MSHPVSRRRFLRVGTAAGAALLLPRLTRGQPPTPGGGKLTKYVEPLPRPGAGIVVAAPSAPDVYQFTLREITRQLHPELPPTPIWAYDDGSALSGQAGSFGMAISARVGTPISASYTHALPFRYPERIPVDTRLAAFGDEVRVMTHLHGGFVAGDSDGNPAVTSIGFGSGETQVVTYSNEAPQTRASLLWFHDHGPGVTRLNVSAGLAAAYLLRDDFDTGEEPNPIGIPGDEYEIPLVIQDRQFNADGTFLYPTSDIEGATWIGEYFGDVMLVNGKVWPFLEVEPRIYRLRFLNGCNARILNLALGAQTFWQIGGDGGLFDVPVPVNNLVLAPAERADVLVDFSAHAGTTLVLKNHKPRRPVSNPAPPLEAVMQIRVGTGVTRRGPTTIPASLPGVRADLPDPAVTRYFTLNEIEPEQLDWHLNIGGVGFADAAAAATPAAATVEDWVYVNLTGDTHPMHVHLVTFQVLGRTPFDQEAYERAYSGPDGVPGGIDPTPFATGPMVPAPPEERGFKDTVKANPGFFTSIRAKFDLPAGVAAPQTYVHHCHILEHEDNDMMQRYTVVP